MGECMWGGMRSKNFAGLTLKKKRGRSTKLVGRNADLERGKAVRNTRRRLIVWVDRQRPEEGDGTGTDEGVLGGAENPGDCRESKTNMGKGFNHATS